MPNKARLANPSLTGKLSVMRTGVEPQLMPTGGVHGPISELTV